jgi:hypothetical protein
MRFQEAGYTMKRRKKRYMYDFADEESLCKFLPTEKRSYYQGDGFESIDTNFNRAKSKLLEKLYRARDELDKNIESVENETEETCQVQRDPYEDLSA